MTLARVRCLRGLIVLGLSVGASAVLAAEPSPWNGFQDDLFTTYSQVKERHSREIVREMQLFHASLGKMLSVKATPPRVPVRMFLLDRKNFERAARGMGQAAGFFTGQAFENYIVVDASESTRMSLSIVYHEYVHFQMRNQGHVMLPAYYSEGMAQMAQTFIPFRREIHYGFFPQRQPESLSQAMPLKRLVGIDVGSEDYVNHQVQPGFYLRSLLLLHFCTLVERSCHQPLLRFTTRVANGEPPEPAFQQEFGMSMDEFDAVLDKFIKRGGGASHAVTPMDQIRRPPEAQPMPVSEAEGNLALAEMLIEIGQFDAQIEADVTPALSEPALRSRALAALAHYYASADRHEDSGAQIEALLAEAEPDSRALAAAAAVTMQRARRDRSMEAFNEGRDLWRKALARDPANLEAAYGLGFAQVMHADDEDAANWEAANRAVQDALQRYPESGELKFLHASFLLRDGKEKEALPLIAYAGCRSVDGQVRAMVRDRYPQLKCARARE